MSTIELPVKPKETQTSSVFLKAIEITDMLLCIPGWKESYYDPIMAENSEANPTDILWKLFRQGGTLCICVNLLQKNTIQSIAPLDMKEQGPTFDHKACKNNVYNFLVACSEDLFMPDDQIFQVTDIYKNDTIGLVKVQ
jgi:hypothetical protein